MKPNKEALRLYRDIVRATRLYTWTDEKGVPWREVLLRNARNEFEAGNTGYVPSYALTDPARHESDPLVVMRLLVGGRDYLMQAQEKYMQAYQRLTGDIEAKKK